MSDQQFAPRAIYSLPLSPYIPFSHALLWDLQAESWNIQHFAGIIKMQPFQLYPVSIHLVNWISFTLKDSQNYNKYKQSHVPVLRNILYPRIIVGLYNLR